MPVVVNRENELPPSSTVAATAVLSGKDTTPKKRRFVDYRLEHDQVSDGFFIVEEFEEWDRARNEYRLKRVASDIELPARAILMLTRPGSESVAQAILAFCSGMRRELDKAGVKVYFDIPRVDDESVPLRAKWTYYFDGRRVDDYIDWETLPEMKEMIRLFEVHKELWPLVKSLTGGMPAEKELLEAGIPSDRLDDGRDSLEAMRTLYAKYGSCRYYETREWKNWYGKAMQAKRERIISTALARKFDIRSTVHEESGVPTPSPSSGTVRPFTKDGVLSAARQAFEDLCRRVSEPIPIEDRFNWIDAHVVGIAETFLDKFIAGLDVDEADRPSREELARMIKSVQSEYVRQTPAAKSATSAGTAVKVEPVGEQTSPASASWNDRTVILNVPVEKDGDGLQKVLGGIIAHLVVTTSCLDEKMDKEGELVNRISARVAAVVMQRDGGPKGERFRTQIAEYDAVGGKLIIKDMSRLGTLIKKVCFEVLGIRPSSGV